MKLRKGKTKRKDVQLIEADLDTYVSIMVIQLQNTRPGGDKSKAFCPRKYNPITINEHGKKRKIYCPDIWEQWYHHIIVQVLSPIIIKYGYKYSCGSVPKRGGHYGKREIEHKIHTKLFKYFAKWDIRHYFNSIRLDVVIKELETYIEDHWFIYLIEVAFKYFKVGIPLGFYLSQWISNFILTRVDWVIQRFKPICYVRYVDDFVVCDNNKKTLHRMIIAVKKALGRLKLKLKTNYQVSRFSYGKNPRGIDFMGFVFYKDRTIIRKRILIKMSRVSRKLSNLTSISPRQASGLLSRLGWIKHTGTYYIFRRKIAPVISFEGLKDIVRLNEYKKEVA